MKYIQALKDKGLTVEEMSQATKERIKKIKILHERGRELQGKDELTEDDEEELGELVEKIQNLDSELERIILKFDPEMQKFRANVAKKAFTKDPEARKSLEIESEKIDELKEVKVDTTAKIEPKQVEQAHEVEEFEKKKEVKPKKMSWSVIIMGVGALILTYGAVNFFRERR